MYPEHEHPHGITGTPPNLQRIWVCEECDQIFTDEEIRKDCKNNEWGHICKYKNPKNKYRCESHLEPYMPDLTAIKVKR